MAQISFTSAKDTASDNSSVSFFTLKNDGDEAIVRIMHNSVDDLTVNTVHPIEVAGRFRNVNCLRSPNDPVSACPMCNAGNRISNKVYLKMYEYGTDNTGTLVCKPVIWERTMSFVKEKIIPLMSEYQNRLSDVVIKIKRCGAAGSMQTTYSVLAGNPAVYSPDKFPLPAQDMFEDFPVIGVAVMDKNFDELTAFVTTGSFPETAPAQQQETAFNRPQMQQPMNAFSGMRPAPNMTEGNAFMGRPGPRTY